MEDQSYPPFQRKEKKRKEKKRKEKVSTAVLAV